jgi:hypothetical protein
MIAAGFVDTIEVMPAGANSRSVTKRHHGMPLTFSVINWQRKSPASE